ncbi:MAG: UDP-N-acetylglucosamine pyrophosphorylase [Myxococcales bacterium]|nr:UDP-N-acetylglucosamine pyrophosphorylase [Myxococcales bacterium]
MEALRRRAGELDARLAALAERGVIIVDPRQTYVGPAVDLERISEGVVLHPGARICGRRSLLGPRAEVGAEGPATLVDAVLGEGAKVASGYVEGAVLLRGASLGGAAHVRGGTLLEEEASTAHAVGLKQTILLAFVTLGSLINFCDCLMAGGSSRRDHSEVGSGYIHFNFTPWGARGDKATPSLIGEVPRGVLLRERRIFLGGSGGMIGPRRVGFGAVVGAGSILRDDVGEGRLALQGGRNIDRPLPDDHIDPLEPRLGRNLRYIGELAALRRWYLDVRRPRIPAAGHGHLRLVIDEAIANLDGAIAERTLRLAAFARERGMTLPTLPIDQASPCPLTIEPEPELDYVDHVAWVQGLGDARAEALRAWLVGIAAAVVAAGEG